MLNTTVEAVRAVLKSDPSLTPSDRTRITAAIRNHGKAKPEAVSISIPAEQRLIRRIEAARRLSVSLRTIDKLCVQGTLRKFTLPGRTRAAGFLEADLVGLLKGQAVSQ